MSIFLHALTLKNYRGIGAAPQYIGPFKNCNFFIGTNNSGKSCVLNFISAHLSNVALFGNNGPSQIALSPLEVHLGAANSQVEFGFGVPIEKISELAIENLRVQTQSTVWSEQKLKELLVKIAESGLVWIGAPATNLHDSKLLRGSVEEIRLLLDDSEWRALWNAITRSTNGDPIAHWVPQVIAWLLPLLRLTYPPAKIIPAKRQIGEKGGSFEDFSGTGLIDKLAELQNPGPTARRLREKFDKINAFLQDVTGDSSALIEIPHDRQEVLVHKGERVLPLSSLGTGIHEVVMIAAFCTLTEKNIVCIEEPEIHLHPLLQKKLIRYITHKTNNQYFIATHSASIIDQVGAAVFHVTERESCTHIEPAALPSQRFRVCQDLGYKASDLLQTNAIIWVEGPSDRIYLKHWIEHLDSTIQEGIHYSIMFYGGRLLSHLSADDDEINEFIALRRLNRNVAIVIDSDRKAAQSKLNATKKRVISEFTSHGDPAWVTAGREIENYISPAILEMALRKHYMLFDRSESVDKYAHSLHFLEKGKGMAVRKDVDKVKIARAVCSRPANLNVYDLEGQINKIVKMIRTANE